jgi:hypothetical protein
MKTVVIYGMKAKPGDMRKIALKIGVVLEYLYEQEVPSTPGAVIQRLKSEGGVDKMYRLHCSKKKTADENNADVDTLPDDLDLLGGDGAANDAETETSRRFRWGR